MRNKQIIVAAVFFMFLFIIGGCDFLVSRSNQIEKNLTENETEETVSDDSISDESADNSSTDDAVSETTEEQEAAVIPEYSKVLKIWTGGDSITAAWQSYRCGIWESMNAAGNEIDFVGTVHWDTNVFMRNPDEDHNGHSGYTIAKWREEFSDTGNGKLALMQAEKPDVLLLMIGTNDLAWWVPNDDIARTITDSMMDLVEQIFTWFPGMSIIVGTIPPMSEETINTTGRNRADYATEYRTLLKTAVQNHPLFGSRLFLSDNYSVLSVDDLYDGIHPSEEGHDKMAQEWLRALAEYMETLNTTD